MTLRVATRRAVLYPATVAAAGNWWEAGGATGCLAAYQPKAAASYAASLTDLSGNGNDAAEGTAPSWSGDNGWQFTGASSQYLTSGIVPEDGYSMICRFDNASPAGWMLGADSASNARFYLSPVFSSTQRLYGSGGFNIVSGELVSGVMAIADQQPYLDGSTDGSPTANWSTTQSNAVLLGALNSTGGSPSQYFTGDIMAFAIYSTTLSGAQVSAITDAMNAL